MRMKIDDIELYCELHGKGKPIIFSHGWLDDCSVWRPQIEFFAKKYSVLMYDHRGHGRSDKPKGNYSVQTLSNDLYTLIQKQNLGKVTLVGHSMGGMTALIFALDHPDKVSKLVLVGTAAKVPFSMRVSGVTRYFIPYKTFMRRSVESGYYKPSEQLIKNSMATAMNTSKHAAYQCFTELTAKYDIRDRVSKIKSPTLIVVGEKDKDLPVKLSQYLNREIEGSKLQIIPDSGHMVIVEKPEEFSQVLGEFIR